MVPDLIQNGFRAPPTEELEEGFNSVLVGLEKLRRNEVSGKKLVVKIA